jgi:tight adherence protein B
MSPPVLASWGLGTALGVLATLSLVLGRRASQVARSAGLAELAGSPLVQSGHRSGIDPRWVNSRLHSGWMAPVLGVLLGWVGLRLAGVVELVAGLGAGSAIPFVRASGRRRRLEVMAETQVAEIAESTAMALRSGLSIRQGLEFAATEIGGPIGTSVEAMVVASALGSSLEDGLARWAAEIGSDEARLLSLILAIHVRSGGDLPGALDEAARTIRHRMSVRRELRALSAQGRMSGAILGSLPVAFFLVLTLTSRSELVPVYRSAAGATMLISGLVLELLAYLWIRRMLRIEV